MSSDPSDFDFVVIGAGSAGCAVTAGLTGAGAGSVAVVEAGPSDAHPLVKMPLGLIWLIGSGRDWRLRSAPQKGLGGRRIKIPRGRMLGGSGSINSMVWFRGTQADFDNWQVPGWAWDDVAPAFEAVEAKLTPAPLTAPHPLVRALGRVFGANEDANPTPERESAGVFRFNLRKGRRWSAADAFLRPARGQGAIVLTGRNVARIGLFDGAAREVIFTDGSKITARRGVILSAGAIGSPEILLRSGIGPQEDLEAVGITPLRDVPGVGANLHDHPGVGIHYSGKGSGYGLSLAQAAQWIAAPFRYLFARGGVLASPTVEGGMFFSAGGGDMPDIQTHFIPFFMNHKGSRFAPGEGYFADVCVCRPRSRGALRITPEGTDIDLGLFNDEADLDLLVAGFKRLRTLMDTAPFENHKAPEVHPGPAVQSDADIRAYIRASAGTAYHPVGTLRMGDGDAPVSPRLAFKGIENLWVADASVMPAVTSANTNAPSMMIGYRAAQFITEDAA